MTVQASTVQEATTEEAAIEGGLDSFFNGLRALSARSDGDLPPDYSTAVKKNGRRQ